MGTFDLGRDSKTLLSEQWLEEGEWLRACVPTWSLARFEGVPKPHPTAGQAWAAVGRFLLRIPVYLFVAWIALLFMESGADLEAPKRGRPAAFVWGGGRDSQAGSFATPALRRRGIWVLTDRRVAFLGVRARTTSRLFSEEPVRGKAHKDYRPVPIETIAEFPAAEWRYEGTVERTRTTRFRKRVKTVGKYHRVVFADGSGIDVFRRPH